MWFITGLGAGLLLLSCIGVASMQVRFAVEGALLTFEPQFAYTMAGGVLIAEVGKLVCGHWMIDTFQGRRWRWAVMYAGLASVTTGLGMIGSLHKKQVADADASAVVSQYREQEAKRASLHAEVEKLELQIGAGGRAWDVVDAEYRRIANTRITCTPKYRDTLCDQLDRLADEAKKARVVLDAKANRDKLNSQLAAMPPFDAEKDLHMRRIEPNRTSSDWSSVNFDPNRIGSVVLELLLVAALLLISLLWPLTVAYWSSPIQPVSRTALSSAPNSSGSASSAVPNSSGSAQNRRTNVRTWVLSEIQRDGELIGSQIQLAARAGCSKSSISEALGVLEAEGKIRRDGHGKAQRWIPAATMPALLKVVK